MVPNWLASVGAVAAILAALAMFFTAVGTLLSKIVQHQNGRQEDRITSAVENVVDERLTPIREQIDGVKRDVALVKREVTFNSGKSLKDVVHRVERRVEGLALIRESESRK